MEPLTTRLAEALAAVLGDADLQSADGNDDTQQCVDCRTEYPLDDFVDEDLPFLCQNPDCPRVKARKLLEELK